MLRFAIIFALILANLPAYTRADQADVFHQTLSDAYAHYREAFFYLRRSNIMAASFELETMIEKWQLLEKKFSRRPPTPYIKDVKWGYTLGRIGLIAKKAHLMASNGDPASAYATLKPVRLILSDLRRRNGVIRFRDYVEAANLEFAKLFRYRHNTPDFNNSDQVKLLREHLNDTTVAYQECLNKAPPSVSRDQQFVRLVSDSLHYLGRIKLAIDDRNKQSLINILRRLVSSDKLLWLHFG